MRAVRTLLFSMARCPAVTVVAAGRMEFRTSCTQVPQVRVKADASVSKHLAWSGPVRSWNVVGVKLGQGCSPNLTSGVIGLVPSGTCVDKADQASPAAACLA